MEPIIKSENLSVVYDLGKSNETWAIRDINLEIYPEEYIIFFGPSGCGKSTILYCIAGLQPPTDGRIIIEGKDLTQLPPEQLVKFHQKSIGMIFQTFYLIPNLTAKDNVALPLLFSGASSSKIKEKVHSLTKRFGIARYQNRRPTMLSGGEQQRVAIARALVNDPSIVLADEPVGNLDSKNAEIVSNLISELNQKDKKTIIQVTHDARYLYLANRIFYMKDGKISRVVVNPRKTQLTPQIKKSISELERLARAYPYLNESRLRAKLILNHLLLPYGVETLEKIEEVIDNYLKSKIEARGLFEALDQPPINLYVQTAQDLTQKVVNLAKEIERIEEEEYPALTPVEEKAMVLRGFLLDKYKKHLNFEQVKLLEKFLIQRLLGQIDKKGLEKYLDIPLKKGGVGLNRRTARRFAQEIELILMRK